MELLLLSQFEDSRTASSGGEAGGGGGEGGEPGGGGERLQLKEGGPAHLNSKLPLQRKIMMRFWTPNLKGAII